MVDTGKAHEGRASKKQWAICQSIASDPSLASMAREFRASFSDSRSAAKAMRQVLYESGVSTLDGHTITIADLARAISEASRAY
jgi:hypothetical protein